MYKRTFMQTLAAVAMMMLPAACADDYDDSALWDKVNDHEERLAALEKWQEQTNQSIAAMQELLNTTDMITGVSAVSEGGQTVGYTITFLHSDPITIYNGAKGAGLDGADGEDGEDGATGPEGPQGNDGTSAPTPQIKLGSNVTGTIMTDNGQTIADVWYLSVDGGATWYRVSGKDGTNGDAWFSDEPKKEGNYYVFTLTDQSTFRVAAYQPFRILTEAEKNGTDNFTNATVTINGATTLYLSIDEGIEYSSIVAQATPVDGDAVLTRADGWSAKVAESTDGITVTVTPGTQPYALLDVSLLLTDGSKLTASRLLEDPGYTVDGNTYIVYTPSGLLAWAEAARKDPTLNCTLAADITLPAVPTDQSNWTPVCSDYDNPYTGTFDGGNHTITGLTVTTSDQYAGLFGYIIGTVKNVTLKGVKIESKHDVGSAGGVAGWSYGNIENCSVSGSVSGSGSHSIAGGVVGYQSGGFLTGCSSSATVNAGGVAGGVAGLTDSGATLTACYATGDVTLESINSGGNFVGGVVGSNTSSTLKACYAWGKVTGSGSGTIYAGGVTGSNDLGTLTACYHAKGTVSGPDGATGGVAGRNFKDSMFGGGIITACYWGGNGQEQGIGEDQAGTGETTKVDGTVDWIQAKEAMNSALQDLTTWCYDLGEGLPVLTQQP